MQKFDNPIDLSAAKHTPSKYAFNFFFNTEKYQFRWKNHLDNEMNAWNWYYFYKFCNSINILAPWLHIRVMFSNKKIIFYGGNFNTSSLYNQKVDIHHKKWSKAKELTAWWAWVLHINEDTLDIYTILDRYWPMESLG